MPDWSLVTRAHVLAALAEHDRIGDREFLRRYGFGRAHAYVLWHGGRDYDCKAIVGVAYLHATGTALTSQEFSGGKDGATGVLTDLGFDVVVDEEAVAAEKPRKVTPPRKRTVKAEAAPRVCPRCFMALPATGVCDFCD